MVLFKLYKTNNGIVSLDSDKIGEIIVEVEDNSYVETFTKTKIHCFIEDDKEKLYFPQPVDMTSINNSISQYGFSLYIIDNTFITDESRINKVLKFYKSKFRFIYF